MYSFDTAKNKSKAFSLIPQSSNLSIETPQITESNTFIKTKNIPSLLFIITIQTFLYRIRKKAIPNHFMTKYHLEFLRSIDLRKMPQWCFLGS